MADLVGRLTRASLENDGGLIATSKGEARAVLFSVQSMLAKRNTPQR